MNEDSIKKYASMITSANRSELTSIIYDIIEEELTMAEEKLSSGRKDDAEADLTKARDFVNELTCTLDMKYDISGRLASLYIYVCRCINRALVNGRAEEIKEARHIMSALGDSFKKVADHDKSRPVMENTQSVYAGLTYGKGRTPDEVMISSNEADRGYLA